MQKHKEGIEMPYDVYQYLRGIDGIKIRQCCPGNKPNIEKAHIGTQYRHKTLMIVFSMNE
jgi:hypothetical protein